MPNIVHFADGSVDVVSSEMETIFFGIMLEFIIVIISTYTAEI